MLFSMTKIVLKMIPLGFKGVIVFILYLPSCPTCLYNFFHIFPCNLVMGFSISLMLYFIFASNYQYLTGLQDKISLSSFLKIKQHRKSLNSLNKQVFCLHYISIKTAVAGVKWKSLSRDL